MNKKRQMSFQNFAGYFFTRSKLLAEIIELPSITIKLVISLFQKFSISGHFQTLLIDLN